MTMRSTAIWYLAILIPVVIPLFDDSGADDWYISSHGKDEEECGKNYTSSCKTFPFLLEQFRHVTIKERNLAMNLNIITDTDIYVDDLKINGASENQNYQMKIYSKRSECLKFQVSNCHLKGVHFYSTVVSYYVYNTTFNETRLKLESDQGHCDHSVIVENCSFFGVSAIDLKEVQNATIMSSIFEDISGEEYRDNVIIRAEKSYITMNNCTFKGNVSTIFKRTVRNGPTIAAVNSTLKIFESNFEGNAGVRGGAIFVNSTSDLEICNCMFEDNAAYYGGSAIYIDDESNSLIRDSMFHSSVVHGRERVPLTLGGTIYVANGNLTVLDTQFFRNFATKGAALYCVSGGMSLSNVTLRENIAQGLVEPGGAAVWASNCTVHIWRSNVTDNLVLYQLPLPTWAERIHVPDKESRMPFSNSSYNRFNGYDDVSYVDLLNAPNVRWSGGAIRAQFSYLNISDTKFEHNGAPFGGALLLAGCTMMVTRSSFLLNFAAKGGVVRGTLGVNTGSEDGNGSRNSHLVSSSSVLLFSNNTIFQDNSATVGGVGFINALSVTLDSSLLINNKASNISGVLLVEETNVTISNCSIVGNTASRYSAVLFAHHSILSVDNGTTFQGNSALYGGIGRIDNSSAAFTSCYWINNTASEDVGALMILDSNVTISNCTIVGNTAEHDAVLWADRSILSIDNGTTFQGNSAQIGGIGRIDNSSATFTSCYWIDNTASEAVGALEIWDSNVTISNCSIVGNTASKHDAVLWANRSILSIDNGTTFQGNSAPFNGIGRIMSSSATFTSCYWINNTASIVGGALGIVDSNVTISNCSIVGNTASDYFAVLFAHHSILSIDNGTTFQGNSAPYGGIGIIVSSSATFTSCYWIDNTASEAVGALEIWDSNMTISNCSIVGNTASNKAGVMRIQRNSTLQVCDNTDFEGNAAAEGGIGHILGSSSATFDSCTFKNNSASKDSGALFIEESNVIISNCSIFGNTAADKAGVMWTQGDSVLRVGNNTVFEGNSAANGGIGYIDASSVTIDNSFFKNNNASNKAGTFFLTHISCLQVSDTVFENNACTINGGVFFAFLNSSININDSIFVGNKALGSSGGVIFLESQCHLATQNCTFRQNTASEEGGVVFVMDHSTYNDTDGLFVRNSASDTGGAITITDNSQTSVMHSNFSENRAASFPQDSNCSSGTGHEHDGGAIMLKHGKAEFVGCHFTANQASGSGGALYVKGGGLLSMVNSNFESNHADNGGGSVVAHTSDVVVTSCTFARELVANGFGGSILAVDIGNVTIENCTFYECWSYENGGTMSVLSRSRLKIVDSAIKNSISNSSGGALYIKGASFLFAGNVSIASSVSKSGAGLAVDSGKISLENIKISFNNATESGGAISCRESKINLKSGNLDSNIADLHGGGIFMEKCEVMADKIKFRYNQAGLSGGAIWASQSSNIEIHNSQGIENTAGNIQGQKLPRPELFYQMPWTTIHDPARVRDTQTNALTGGFIVIIFKSELSTQVLQLKDNIAKGNGTSIMVAENSVAEITNTYINESYTSNFSAIAVRDDCRLIITSVHIMQTGENSRNCTVVADDASSVHVEVPTHSSLTLPSICADINVTATDNQPEDYPKSCIEEAECNCFSNTLVTSRPFVANCSFKTLTQIPSLLPTITDWLILSGNNLSSLSNEYVNLSCLKHVSKFVLHGSNIENITPEFLDIFIRSEKLTSLDISNNKLTTLPENIKNLTSLKDLKISNNPFKCLCENIWMRDWVSNNSMIFRDYHDVKCHLANENKTIQVIHVNETRLGCIPLTVNSSSLWKTLVIVGVALSFVMLVVIATRNWDAIKFWMFLKFGILIKDKNEALINEDGMDYDAFINFNVKDHKWVLAEIVRYLESEKLGYSVCIHPRDFVPGFTIQRNIETAIKHSRRLISVVTRNYLNSPWCKEEFMQAHREVVEGRYRFIILLMTQDINIGDLPDHMQTYAKTRTYIEVNDMELFRKKLVYAMPRTPLGKLRDGQYPDEYNENFPALFNRLNSYGDTAV